jgi:hypothetical protein
MSIISESHLNNIFYESKLNLINLIWRSNIYSEFGSLCLLLVTTLTLLEENLLLFGSASRSLLVKLDRQRTLKNTCVNLEENKNNFHHRFPEFTSLQYFIR